MQEKGRRKPGRPKGKSSNPNYTRLTAYIPRSLDKQMRHAAVDEDLEISDVVERALAEYLERRKQNPRSPEDQP